jgi:hypothetical protein
MENLRVDIKCISVADASALTQVQSQINQWLTKGELKKYEVHTTSTHIVFNICRTKAS